MSDFYVVHTKPIEEANEKLLNLLNTWHSISLPNRHADYNDMLVWCLEMCCSKFRDIPHNEVRTWYFKEKKDLTMFLLKWGSK
jgi:hypothetical protein